jgi:transketolase
MTAAPETTAMLRQRAQAIRQTVLQMCMGRGQGYAGQGLALADLMACLYFHALREDDLVVLSTGHSAIAVYAAMHELGHYTLGELETYGMDGSRIEESPLEGTPGFPITGGSLGQGLSQAAGLALGARIQHQDRRVFCIVSDGELQEGQIWEAAMFIGHHHLSNLTLIVDNNEMQADGLTSEVMTVEPVDGKLNAFGFATRRIDPHDIDEILVSLTFAAEEAGPVALIADTQPGKGVPSFEATQKVHYIRADRATWERALQELSDHSR